MNDNTELLTWAVENITEWNDDYTHLRSDSSRIPLFFTYGDWFIDGENDWHPIGRADHTSLYKNFYTKTPQVITKQEWQAAKASSNALKTAQEATQGHIHAKLMAEYAIVAKTNPEPWEEFEVKYERGGDWSVMTDSSVFNSTYMYRRKPKPKPKMNIGGIIVEACPLKHIEIGQEFYEITQHFKKHIVLDVNNWRFAGDTFKCRALKTGYIFATQQEAQAVADALNNLYKKAVDEVWNS